MTSTEQWYYWNLMMDVQDNTNHCQKLKTGLTRDSAARASW